tara:strand:- start:90 stop:461 length:372 start_codon:yes stop_codon:yes gene_type:complete
MLSEDRPIHRKEMRVFLSLLHELVDRWYAAVGPMNNEISALRGYHIELIHDLEDCFNKLIEDDTEDVLENRHHFAMVFDAVGDMLLSFSSVFAGPNELITFYSRVLSRLEKTVTIIPEGKHGW